MPKAKKKVEATEEEVANAATGEEAPKEETTEKKAKKADFGEPVHLKTNRNFKLWQTDEAAFHIKNERDQVIAHFSDPLEAEDTLRNLTR